MGIMKDLDMGDLDPEMLMKDMNMGEVKESIVPLGTNERSGNKDGVNYSVELELKDGGKYVYSEKVGDAEKKTVEGTFKLEELYQEELEFYPGLPDTVSSVKFDMENKTVKLVTKYD